MKHLLDLERFPLDAPDSARGRSLLAGCRQELQSAGMFSLEGLILPEALERCIAELGPLFE
ncbi:MAG: 2OG-Fe(II) oxygenase, partial [Rhodospirillaceae bacterium]|nr:2OG-Fe(II) oxygenase [Rhodospirillaceae bacterium]